LTTFEGRRLESIVTKINLLIVDDHPVFRQGLVDVLEIDPALQVVAEAADGDVAIAQAIACNPDVVLMDINLPTVNGLQVTRKLVNQLPNVKVIVITGYDDAEQVFHALRAGAVAYCSKDIPPEDLIDVVHAVYGGKYVVDGNVMEDREILEWINQRIGRYTEPAGSDTQGVFAPLSPREMEILELVTKGSSNKEIAYRLDISHQTVKNHMTAILRKLRVDDRTQAAVYALRHGWVRLDNNPPPRSTI
jgi:DNA-binding NarL/FixJ family response regulator